MAKSREMAQSNVSPAKGFAAWQALTKALFDDYRPELHYMRGPGPKWHEKHDRAEIDGASPAVTRALMAGLRPRVDSSSPPAACPLEQHRAE
jgi:hypothetical protein